ncbi:MAG: cupin domain-containing protein, partial [Cellvibrionaceae bacterium]|nr:cupin domain-containing protein [Cellvibrionaceae bacterium]
MSRVLQQLGEISVEEFLRDYWQQKPLLIRQALPGFTSPLSPDELAGLSLEDEIESRIVLENHRGSPWQLRCGPFAEDAYQDLPERNWTLLLQALDHYIPELTELLQRFRFLPSWRLDDIMASYAVDGGSVGPHYDHYDVFLLQGLGKRHWQIGQYCDQHSELLPGTPLNILREFEPSASWVLEPGDMLYLPPKLAHWGIAQGECITYSVGFRAASEAQLVEEFFQAIEGGFTEFQRYGDAAIKQRPHASEINRDDIARVQAIIEKRLKPNATQTAEWFGRWVSECKYPDQALVTVEAIAVVGADQMPLLKSPDARFAFYRIDAEQALLFVNGQSFHCRAELACAIAESDIIDTDILALDEQAGTLL